jgi:hypothetical protein
MEGKRPGNNTSTAARAKKPRKDQQPQSEPERRQSIGPSPRSEKASKISTGLPTRADPPPSNDLELDADFDHEINEANSASEANRASSANRAPSTSKTNDVHDDSDDESKASTSSVRKRHNKSLHDDDEDNESNYPRFRNIEDDESNHPRYNNNEQDYYDSSSESSEPDEFNRLGTSSTAAQFNLLNKIIKLGQQYVQDSKDADRDDNLKVESL